MWTSPQATQEGRGFRTLRHVADGRGTCRRLGPAQCRCRRTPSGTSLTRRLGDATACDAGILAMSAASNRRVRVTTSSTTASRLAAWPPLSVDVDIHGLARFQAKC